MSCLCAFSRIPISPFFHFMKCFFSLVIIIYTTVTIPYILLNVSTRFFFTVTVTIPYIFLNVSTRFFFTVTSRYFTQCACAEFTCSTPHVYTVLAVYKVVQMDPKDRKRARLSRRRQRERDRRTSESAEQRESRLARRRARDRARRASQSEIHQSTKFMVYSLSIA